MKRLISIILMFALILTSCGNKVGSTPEEISESVENETTVPSEENKQEEAAISETNDESSSNEVTQYSEFSEEDYENEDAEHVTTEFRNSNMSDQELLQYVVDNVYANLESELDTDKYKIEGVGATYVSQEYLDELEYNSQESIYFGYSLSEVDANFGDTKYIFTIGEDNSTVVQELVEYKDNTFNDVVRNVAIGSGVILVCVTISVVSGGLGAPVVSFIFAGAADTALSYAIHSAIYGGITAAVMKGYQTGDFEEAAKAGAVAASEGFKWGAIIGAVVGGTKNAIQVKKGNVPHTPKQSEIDVANKYGGKDQVSYLNGKEVPFGTEGSTRPDIVRQVGNHIEAIEVKNYDLNNNKAKLIKVLMKEISDRVNNLPSGSTQRIVLDVRGRGYDEKFLNAIAKQIQEALMKIYPNIPVDFLRW